MVKRGEGRDFFFNSGGSWLKGGSLKIQGGLDPE